MCGEACIGAAGASVSLKEGVPVLGLRLAFSGTHFSSGIIVLTGDTSLILMGC